MSFVPVGTQKRNETIFPGLKAWAIIDSDKQDSPAVQRSGKKLHNNAKMPSIAENLQRVREQIAQAANKSGRSIEDVDLVAISKTHEAAKVREAVEAGQILFGESKVQEARVKIPDLPSNLRWHFVGHLQKNKSRRALPVFELIRRIDLLALVQKL